MMKKRIMLVKVLDQTLDIDQCEELLKHENFGCYSELVESYSSQDECLHFLTYMTYEQTEDRQVKYPQRHDIEVISFYEYETISDELMPPFFLDFAKRMEKKLLCPHCNCNLMEEPVYVISETQFVFDEETRKFNPVLVSDFGSDIYCPACGNAVINKLIEPYLDFKDIQIQK